MVDIQRERPDMGGFSAGKCGTRLESSRATTPTNRFTFPSGVQQVTMGDVDTAIRCLCHTAIHVEAAAHLGFLLSHSSRGMHS